MLASLDIEVPNFFLGSRSAKYAVLDMMRSENCTVEMHQRYSPLSINIEEISSGNGKLRFRSPQYFFPELTNSDLMIVRNPDLGIDVFGESVSELQELILERIAVLWTTYMSRDDTQLTPRARKVKQNLRALISEVENG